VWKFGYEIPNGCGDNEGVDNFVAWEEQIIMLKTVNPFENGGDITD